MTQQTRIQDIEPSLAAVDESWQGFFFAGDPAKEGAGRAVANSLDAWATDQLFGEVLERSANDAPALRRMQGIVLQALLTALDGEPAFGRG